MQDGEKERLSGASFRHWKIRGIMSREEGWDIIPTYVGILSYQITPHRCVQKSLIQTTCLCVLPIDDTKTGAKHVYE